MNATSSCKVILQARVSSTRLPKKTILDFFEGKGILEILIERIKLKVPKVDIIIATSKNKENDAIVDIAEKCHVGYYRGSENNVLERFIDTAKAFDIKSIVRVCSDNVFMDITDLARLYNLGKSPFKEDYIAYKVGDKPNILTHYGLWGELMQTEALEKVIEKTQNPLFLEHVTNYLYTNANEFNIKWLNPFYIPGSASIRLTTDTKEDFEVHKKLFEFIYPKFGLEFETRDILDLLKTLPEIKRIMSTQIIENEK